MEGQTSPPTTTGKQRGLLILAILVSVVSLMGPVAMSGIWEPHELRVAELSRRIALTLLGAQDLSVAGAANQVPTLGELSRGQLPFTSIALGFRTFGLAEWAGRIPLVLWGFLGLGATYVLVRRLVDGFAAALSVMVLATMPIYFLHARTMLGDIVTMASVAVATAGLTLATFDPKGKAPSRLAWLVLGLLGAAAGFGARGLLIGVALPSLAVGSTWFILRVSTGRRQTRLGEVAGGICFALGLASTALGAHAVWAARAHPEHYSILVGAGIQIGRKLPTFDTLILQLGHGLFPWSAVVPVVAGYGILRPAPDEEKQLTTTTIAQVTLLLLATLGFGIQGLLASVTEPQPFAATFALAALVGIGLRRLEGGPGTRALGIMVAALAVLLYTDFKNFPEKGLSAFVVSDGKFPDSFVESATRIVKYGAVLAAAGFLGSVMDSEEQGRERFKREDYLGLVARIRSIWDGNLVFALGVLEGWLILLAVLSAINTSWPFLDVLSTLSVPWRLGVRWAWLLFPLIVLGVPLLLTLFRDLCRALYSPGLGLDDLSRAPALGAYFQRLLDRFPWLMELRIRRPTGAVFSMAGFGLVMSLLYYPRLASQLSPKEAFHSYRELARSGEPLGIIGKGAGSATYYTQSPPEIFKSAGPALTWLMAKPEERRWLVARAVDLASLNSLYRAKSTGKANLPVLDARSSEILLVSNRLAAGEQNANPLSSIVLATPPSPHRKLDIRLGKELSILGWEIVDAAGTPVSAVVPGRDYQFRIYYEVLNRLSGNWETFIHIDGHQRRFHGDHKTLDGKYPFRLWSQGDYILDSHPIRLGPNFTPGVYHVFFGLYIGSRRMEVERGAHHENRIKAGTVQVL